jgi:hypothetical protein
MINIFKPNGSNSGHAAFFKYHPTTDMVFLEMIKQSNWDSVNKKGSFKQDRKDPAKFIAVKLSMFELGSIINCFERRTNFSTVHMGTNGSIGINLSVKDKVDRNTNQPIGKFFSLGVTRSNEAVVLREFFKYVLTLHAKKVIEDQQKMFESSRNQPQQSYAQEAYPEAQIQDQQGWGYNPGY